MEHKTAREHIARLTDTELRELIKLASKETEPEGKTIFFLLLAEYENRKSKEIL